MSKRIKVSQKQPLAILGEFSNLILDETDFFSDSKTDGNCEVN